MERPFGKGEYKDLVDSPKGVVAHVSLPEWLRGWT